QRETADHRHAPYSEHERLREADAIAVAFEESRNAHPLGMIAPEAGVNPTGLLETIGEPCGRQRIRSEPPAEIAEDAYHRRKSDADQCESCERAGPAEGRPLGFSWCLMGVRHVLLLSSRCFNQ